MTFSVKNKILLYPDKSPVPYEVIEKIAHANYFHNLSLVKHYNGKTFTTDSQFKIFSTIPSIQNSLNKQDECMKKTKEALNYLNSISIVSPESKKEARSANHRLEVARGQFSIERANHKKLLSQKGLKL